MNFPTNSGIYFLLLEFLFITFADTNALKATNARYPLFRRLYCPRKCDCSYEAKEVKCHYKRLRVVPRGIPNWTKKLSLTGNFIRRFPPSYFRKLRELEELHLNGNILTRISSSFLRNAKKLRNLNLASNRIEQIDKNAFRNTTELRVLRLSKNKLGKLRKDTFHGLSNIVEIYLDDNHLQTMETTVFDHMAHLKKMYLHGNSWHCDCHLKTAEKELRRRGINHGYIICDSPLERKGQVLKEVGSKMCGPEVDKVVGVLMGIILALVVFLFALFMCRKAAGSITQKETIERVIEKGQEKEEKPQNDTDESIRSSIISV